MRGCCDGSQSFFTPDHNFIARTDPYIKPPLVEFDPDPLSVNLGAVPSRYLEVLKPKLRQRSELIACQAAENSRVVRRRGESGVLAKTSSV